MVVLKLNIHNKKLDNLNLKYIVFLNIFSDLKLKKESTHKKEI